MFRRRAILLLLCTQQYERLTFMAENFYIAFNAVAPLSGYILIGVLARKFKIADEELFRKMNSFVFRMLFPIVMFSNIYKADFTASTDLKLVSFILIGTALLAGILVFAVPRYYIKDDPGSAATFIQACYRSNLLLFGIPMASSVFGVDQVGLVSVVCSFLIPLYNFISVIEFEYLCGGSSDHIKLLKNIVTNPLMLGAIAGLIVCLSGIPVPQFMQRMVSEITSGSTFLSLVILGGTLRFVKTRSSIQRLAVCVFLSLAVIPFVMVGLGTLLGFRGIKLFAVLVAFAAPVSVSSYSLACNMGGNADLSSQTICVSTLLSVFTLFFWISLLLGMQLI